MPYNSTIFLNINSLNSFHCDYSACVIAQAHKYKSTDIMKEHTQNMQLSDEVNLQEIFSALWKGKVLIVFITMLAAASAVFYALSLPNIYKSEVLLSPAEENEGGGLSGLASQFGGLASMAGINLGAKSSDKTGLSLEILKSRAFISEFVKKHDLKAKLMATENWDLSTNKLIFNLKIYEPKTKTWIREVNPPLKPEPSDLEVHEYFIENNLSINKDKDTGLVKVAIRHPSPFLAKDIVDKLILSLNEKMKKDDIKEALNSIKYLQDALQTTPLTEMKKVFYQLIEQQEQTKMLASVRDQYVLKTIDPAVVAEIKDSPRRSFICILGVLVGFVFSLFIVLVKYFFITKKN